MERERKTITPRKKGNSTAKSSDEEDNVNPVSPVTPKTPKVEVKSEVKVDEEDPTLNSTAHLDVQFVSSEEQKPSNGNWIDRGIAKVKKIFTKEEPLQQAPQDALSQAQIFIDEDILKFQSSATDNTCQIYTLHHITDRHRVQLHHGLNKEKKAIKNSLYEKYQSKQISYADSDPEKKDRLSSFQRLQEIKNTVSDSMDKLSGPAKMEFEDLNYLTRIAAKEGIDALADTASIAAKFGLHLNDASVLRSRLERIRELTLKNCFTIIILGLEKGGKSTFTNYLIGYDLLPNHQERCTYIRTIIRYKEEDHVSAEVEFYNRQEYIENLAKMAQIGDLSKEEVERQISKFVEQPKITLKSSLEEMRARLYEYVGPLAEDKQYLVKQVVVYTNIFKSTVPIEIIDVPGADSQLAFHRYLSFESVKSADAFIFLTAGNKPDLSQPQINLVRELKEQCGAEMMKKGFAIVTNIDRLTTTKDGEGCFKRAATDLEKQGFSKDKIFQACPAYDLLKKMASINPKLLDENQMKKLQELERAVGSNKPTHPSLKGGTENAKSKAFAYIQEDLPLTRCKELQHLLSDVLERTKDLINQAQGKFADIQTEADNMDAADASEWDSIFEEAWERAKKASNRYGFDNIASVRNVIFKEIQAKYKERFNNSCQSQKAQCSDLKDLVPENSSDPLFVTNHRKIEQDERDRLFWYYYKVLEESADEVSRTIYYSILKGYFKEFMKTLCGGKMVDIKFDLENVLPYNNIKQEVLCLVMRVGYPLANGLLKWPRSDENRAPAINELLQACPEIKAEDVCSPFPNSD